MQVALDMDIVLRCGLCTKPFNKVSTLKRHGYYCRSRRGSRVPRKRSCAACVTSKARCDGISPLCSRCQAKSIPCHYPMQHSHTRISKRPRADDAALEDALDLPDANGKWVRTALGMNETDSLLDPSLIGPFPANSAWTEPALAAGDTSMREAGSMSGLLPIGPTLPTSLSWMQDRGSIPQMIPFHVRSLFRRPYGDGGARKTAALLLNNLGSYPLMILRQHSLPPYIHSTLLSDGSTNDDMEFLCNCVSLMHMMGKGMRGSKKLFWRNVRYECERMCANYLDLNRWELLAAMQALSIYLLVRLYEGETDDNNIDALLITAVTLISMQANQNDAMQKVQQVSQGGLETDWREWIYEESKRRICVIYQVVNLLVFFEPAMLCDLESDLVLAPLPSKRRLWEASDELAWRLEEENEQEDRKSFGLAANGQLVQLDEGRDPCREVLLAQRTGKTMAPQDRNADWTEWCSEMDALGGVVMLAATLYE